MFGVFIEGTYPIRIVLFIGYIGALIIASRALVPRVSDGMVRGARWAALIASAAVFAGSLVGFIAITERHAIPITATVWLMDADELTSSSLANNHVGKAVIGLVVPHLFPDTVRTADTGRGVVPHLPLGFVLLLAASFAVAVAASLIAIGSQPKKRRIAHLALYALLSFIVLAKSLDGGIMSDTALVALAGYGALLFAPSRLPAAASIAFGMQVAGVLLLSRVGGYETAAAGWLSIERAAVLLCTIVSLHAVLTGDRQRIAAASALAALVMAVVAASPAIESRLSYLHAPVEAGSVAFRSQSAVSLTAEGRLGRLTFFALTGTEGSIGALSQALHLPPWYSYFARKERNCALGMSSIVLVPERLEREEVVVPGVLSAAFFFMGNDRSGWYRYKLSLKHDHCLVPSPELLREAAYAAGAKDDVLMFTSRVVAPFFRE